MKRIISGLAVVAALTLAACGSNADTASDNISKEAEKFRIERRIVVTNGINGDALLSVQGFCSVESGETLRDTLDIICKDATGKKKHMVGLSDNTTFTVTQLHGVRVSEYRTKIIFRPTSIVPDFDMVTGNQQP